MTRSRGHFFTLPPQEQDEPEGASVLDDCSVCSACGVDGIYVDGEYICDECLDDPGYDTWWPDPTHPDDYPF